MREPFFRLVVGAPRCGKTTFLKTFCAEYKNKYYDREIVVAYPYQDVKKNDFGANVFLNSIPTKKSGKTLFWAYLKQLKNCLLVIDDVRLFDDTSKQIELSALGAIRGHNSIDILVVYHSFGAVAPAVFQMANGLYCFKIVETYERIKRKVNDLIISEQEHYFARNQKTGKYFYKKF